MCRLFPFAVFALLLLSSCRQEMEPWVTGPPDADGTFAPATVAAVLDAEQKSLFNHFIECSDPATGMTMARSDSPKTFSTGSSGFGVMVMIAGVERGWISRSGAASRIASLVTFLDNAERMHGAWSHWMDSSGQPKRFGDQIESGDLVETSFMLMGLVCANEYFDGDTADERLIREKTEKFLSTVEWDFYTAGEDRLYWLWERTTGEFSLPIRGYNEALVTYILALAAPDGHDVPASVYRNGWLEPGENVHYGREYYGYPLPLGAAYDGALFLSHYSFLALDPSGMEDDYVNYFTNGVMHTMVNRHYCIEEAPEEYGYGEFDWGLTACGGPAGKGYKSRSPASDDGVLAPSAAIASMPYTPFYSIQVLMHLHSDLPQMHTSGGFGDAYSFVDNWYRTERISLSQGAMMIMIENYRSGLFWDLISGRQDIAAALAEAGFHEPGHSPGLVNVIPDVRTGRHDLVRHPDRCMYEMSYWSADAGNTIFTFTPDSYSGEPVTIVEKSSAGLNVLSFDISGLIPGQSYTVRMTAPDGDADSAPVTLR